jgi:type II secretory pathway pseudopilin PulG
MDVRMTALHARARLADLMGVMRGTARRDPTARNGLAASEAGFALIEVMVSATLLVILAIGTLSVLEQSVKSSSMNRSRGIASTLAQADQEHMRQLPLGSIAGGYHPLPQVKNVGGVNYTITSSGDWTRDASGAVTCSPLSTGRAEYLTITSKVTWPGMTDSKTKPVVIQSIVAPGVQAVGPNKGAVAIRLKQADGKGTQGIVVTSGAVAGTTDVDGCVVLANLDAGTHSVLWDANTYVDPDGDQKITKNVSIAAGATAQDGGSYDKAAFVDTSIVDNAAPPATPAAAKWPTVSFSQSGMQNGDRPMPSSDGKPSSKIRSKGLFPFTSAYGVYVGGCNGNDPFTYKDSFAGGASVLTSPASLSTATASMPLVTVKVIKSAGGTLDTGARIGVYPASAPQMTGCTEGIPPARTGYDAAKPLGSGLYQFPLPYGRWNVCADDGSGKASVLQPLENTPTADSTPAFSTVAGVAGPAAQVTLRNNAGKCA